MYLRRFLINCCVKAVLLLIRYYNLLLKKGKADGMKNILKEDLIYEILSVVAEIPLGKVATDGQIARLIGREKYSRLVGRALSMADYYGRYPCHRVVNHAGRLVPGWSEQGDLLRSEGIPMKNDNHVDLKLCRWDC